MKVHSYCMGFFSAQTMKFQISSGFFFKGFCLRMWYSVINTHFHF